MVFKDNEEEGYTTEVKETIFRVATATHARIRKVGCGYDKSY